MRDVLPDIDRWRAKGDSIAVATVIQTWGSAPRGVGAKMAMTPGGEIAGSVSGGCVEGAVYEAGMEALKTGRPQLLHFGVADDTAWEVGLACGALSKSSSSHWTRSGTKPCGRLCSPISRPQPP